MIEHPVIKTKNNQISFEGKEIKVKIPNGKPGLIHPSQIDLTTGIPKKVNLPSEYGNPELWRYWEPDLELVIPTRSYIFLLKQPCWDGKFHINDSFQNLGIRPCCKTLPKPEVNIFLREDELEIKITKEGDLTTHLWKK